MSSTDYFDFLKLDNMVKDKLNQMLDSLYCDDFSGFPLQGLDFDERQYLNFAANTVVFRQIFSNRESPEQCVIWTKKSVAMMYDGYRCNLKILSAENTAYYSAMNFFSIALKENAWQLILDLSPLWIQEINQLFIQKDDEEYHHMVEKTEEAFFKNFRLFRNKELGMESSFSKNYKLAYNYFFNQQLEKELNWILPENKNSAAPDKFKI